MIRKILYFLLILVLLEIFSRTFVYYHNIALSYRMNKGFYHYQGSFWDYLKEYKRFLITTKESMNQLMVSDRYNRRFFIPNLDVNFCGIDLKTNSLGMWEREIGMKKEKDTYRILCLGSSYTRTGHVDTYTAVLEKILNDKYKDKKFEVINAGVPGISILQSFMDFALNWRKINPDMVIIENVLDDVETCVSPFYLTSYAQLRGRGMVFRGYIKERLRNISGIYALLDLLFSGQQPRLDGPTQEGLDYYQSVLESLVLLAKSNSSKVVLLSCGITVDRENNFEPENPKRKMLEHRFPIVTSKGAVEAISRCNRIMADVAKNHNAIFYDMSRTVPKEDDYYVDATHRSDKGNRVFGEALASCLIKSKIFSEE